MDHVSWPTVLRSYLHELRCDTHHPQTVQCAETLQALDSAEDYWHLPIVHKLRALSLLCGHLFDVEPLRKEVDEREVVARAPNAQQDRNMNECAISGRKGTLVCCDGCPLALHQSSLASLSPGPFPP